MRIQADGGNEFTNQMQRDLCWEKNITLSYSPAHHPSSSGLAERMVGILKSTVRRMLNSPSYAQQTSTPRQKMVVLRLSMRKPHDEKENSRKGMDLSIVWTACGNIWSWGFAKLGANLVCFSGFHLPER